MKKSVFCAAALVLLAGCGGGGGGPAGIQSATPFALTPSPDATLVAFLRQDLSTPRASDNDLWVMNADGTGKRLLFDTGSDVGTIAWSPDSTRLAFVHFPTEGDGAELIVLPISDASARRVVHSVNTGIIETVSWDASTSTVRFRAFAEKVEVPGDEVVDVVHVYGTFLINPDGTGLQRID